MGICEFKPIKIDLKNSNYICDRKCKQNDTLILNFIVLDDNLPADLTGYSCVLKVNKNDIGYEIRDTDITKTDNQVKIKCPTSTTQLAGTLKLELFFVDTINNLQKTSFDIEIEVRKSVMCDSNGNVPSAILTQLEHLDESLSKVEDAISKADQSNTALTNTKNAADNSNSALNTSISNANTAKTNCDTATGNLNNAVTVAKGTIEDLKQANTAYTEHINNSDIHVTKLEKDKWNAYEARIIELTSIIDNYIYLDAYVVNGTDNVIDDQGNMVII